MIVFTSLPENTLGDGLQVGYRGDLAVEEIAVLLCCTLTTPTPQYFNQGRVLSEARWNLGKVKFAFNFFC